jgi:multidrug resistance efflux pump
MKKSLVLPFLAILVLAASTVSIVRTQPVRITHAPPMAPPRAEFAERVAAVGLVEPSSENISLSAHLPGVVETVFVGVGDDVKAGDKLVKLDTRALESLLEERRQELMSREATLVTANASLRKARAVLADVQRILHFAESIRDPRAISAEEVTRRRSAVEIAEAEVAEAEAGVAAAEAAKGPAAAALKSVQTDLERSVVSAPIDGRVLQLRIRAGEFAPAGQASSPWLVIGRVSPLHIRVDVDEHEAWRVRPGAKATARVRGNANLELSLAFVRFEPLIVPKQSLTGASTERVDTRVLQAIYRVEDERAPVFVGQQMDVFIDARDLDAATDPPAG